MSSANCASGSIVWAFPLPAGFKPSTWHSVADPLIDCDNNPLSGLSPLVELGDDENNPTIDACFVTTTPPAPTTTAVLPAPACLGDRVILDVDADGVQDAEETGLKAGCS